MIINNLADMVNNFIINLYLNDIKFYQVIMGMLVFNIIIYSLCKLISGTKKIRY